MWYLIVRALNSEIISVKFFGFRGVISAAHICQQTGNIVIGCEYLAVEDSDNVQT